MSPLRQLPSILNIRYVSEDGEEYSADLKPGLSDEFGEKVAASTLDHIHEKAVLDLWENDHGFIAKKATSQPDGPTKKERILLELI